MFSRVYITLSQGHLQIVKVLRLGFHDLQLSILFLNLSIVWILIHKELELIIIIIFYSNYLNTYYFI